MENKDLKVLFLKYDKNTIRIGKLFEIMDLIAGRVCYQHLRQLEKHSFSCVTACVDNFDIIDSNIDINDNIIIDGYITYAGNKTMEI